MYIDSTHVIPMTITDSTDPYTHKGQGAYPVHPKYPQVPNKGWVPYDPTDPLMPIGAPALPSTPAFPTPWPAPANPGFPAFPGPAFPGPAISPNLPNAPWIPGPINTIPPIPTGDDLYSARANDLCTQMECAREAVQCRYLWRQAFSSLSMSALRRLEQVYLEHVPVRVRNATFTSGHSQTLFAALTHPGASAHSLPFLQHLGISLPLPIIGAAFETFIHHLSTQGAQIGAPSLAQPTLQRPMGVAQMHTVCYLITHFGAGTTDPTLVQYLTQALRYQDKDGSIMAHMHANAQAILLEQTTPKAVPKSTKPKTSKTACKRL